MLGRVGYCHFEVVDSLVGVEGRHALVFAVARWQMLRVLVLGKQLVAVLALQSNRVLYQVLELLETADGLLKGHDLGLHLNNLL